MMETILKFEPSNYLCLKDIPIGCVFKFVDRAPLAIMEGNKIFLKVKEAEHAEAHARWDIIDLTTNKLWYKYYENATGKLNLGHFLVEPLGIFVQQSKEISNDKT